MEHRGHSPKDRATTGTLAALAIGIMASVGSLAPATAQPVLESPAPTPPEAPAAAERLAVGTWYGEFTTGENKPVQRFLTTRHENGTFTLHARLYENGKVLSDLRNRGLWGVSNGMYFTVTTTVNDHRTDARAPEVINAYLVRKLDGTEFEYLHVASGNRFRVTRVDPATARLPD